MREASSLAWGHRACKSQQQGSLAPVSALSLAPVTSMEGLALPTLKVQRQHTVYLDMESILYFFSNGASQMGGRLVHAFPRVLLYMKWYYRMT